MEQLVSKTNKAGRTAVSGTPERAWYTWPEDFPETRDYLATDEAKREMQQMVLAHQIYKLRTVRKGLGITQVDLAKKMGVSQIRVSQIETGKLESFELGTLVRYVEALGGRLSLSVELEGAKLELMELGNQG